MPLVTVDIIEIITIMAMIFLVALIIGLVTMYLFMPPPARNIFKGKWLKRGNRNFVAILNDDNVVSIKVGRPKDWGIKVGKKRFLTPRGLGDLVNKRSILGGTGIPYYNASTRASVVASPEFTQFIEELGEVEIYAKDGKDFQKLGLVPTTCPMKDCGSKIEVVEAKNK